VVPDEPSIQEMLEGEVCIPLQTPLVRRGPTLRRSRTLVSIHSLRRSGRIAARPRTPNATRQAQIVLLKKMGIHVDENAPDAEAEAKLKLAFRGDMTQRKQNRLQKLLLGNIDLAALNLNLKGLGNGMA